MARDGKRKILRVGIIQGGRIVEERLIRKREDVTIGQASKNTFILPLSNLPKSFALFESKGEQYFLVFDEHMDGRVSVADQVVDLKALAKSGSAKRRGSRFTVELDERSRGKVVIGEFTLLFQFVDAPPVLPKPQLPAAARGGFGARIDWTFVNILIISFLLQGGTGLGLDLWWRQTGRYLQDQYGQRKTRAYEVLRAEVVRELEEEPPPEEPSEAEEADKEGPESDIPEPTTAPEPEEKPKVAPKPGPPTPKAETDGAPDRKSTRTKEQLKASVTKKTFLHVLGSEDGGGGLLGPSTIKEGVATAKLDDAFENLNGGVATAQPGDKATFVGQPTAVKTSNSGYKGVSSKEVGGTRIATTTVKSTTKEASGGGEVKVRANVGTGSLGGQTGTGKVEKNAVQSVFRRRKKAITYCYEKALKTNENLKGKVVIKFTIGPAGRITSIDATQNTTGDAAVARCIMDKVKTWKFPPPEGGSVTFTFPFILSKG